MLRLCLTGSLVLFQWLLGPIFVHRMNMKCHWIPGFLVFWTSGFLVPWLCWFCFELSGSASSGTHLAQNGTSYYFGIDITVIFSVFQEKVWFFNHKFCHCSLCILVCWIKPIAIWLQCQGSLDLAELSLLTAHTASLCVIQTYCSDASKIRRALMWKLTAEIWLAQNKLGLFFTKSFQFIIHFV